MPVDDDGWPADMSAEIERKRQRGKRLAKQPWYGLGGAVERATEKQLELWSQLIKLRRELRRRALSGRGTAQRDLREIDQTLSALAPKARTKRALEGLVHGIVQRDQLMRSRFKIEALLETWRGQELAVREAVSTNTKPTKDVSTTALPVKLLKHRVALLKKHPHRGAAFDREALDFALALNAGDIAGLAVMLRVDVAALHTALADQTTQELLYTKGLREAAYEVLSLVGYPSKATIVRRLKGVEGP